MQERFSEVIDKDIYSQLSCFSVSSKPTETFDVEEVERMCKLGLISEDFNTIMNRVRVKQKILEIKKSQP